MALRHQLRRKGYVLKHFHMVRHHLTPRKVFNFCHNLLEYGLKTTSPRSRPPFIKIEPTPFCQLRCPGCPQSAASFKQRFNKGMQMSLEEFRRIVDPLADTLLGISLSNRGEPLLNDELPALIQYAHRRNISVSFPTNLSMKLDEDKIEALVLSGLDDLIVSLDGATETTYAKYRIGGDFNRVLSNVQALVAAKRKHRLRRPRVIWKFVVFDHNRHEQDVVVHRHREFGFDGYEFVLDRQSKTYTKVRSDFTGKVVTSNKGCFWLWHSVVVNWDGEVLPCCSPRGFGLGNALSDSVLDIWRSPEYQKLRKSFKGPEGLEEMHWLCRRCLGLPFTRPDDDPPDN